MRGLIMLMALLVPLWGACGDDDDKKKDTSAGTDAQGDTSTPGDTSEPTTFPDIVYGELLPVAADFDDDY